MTRGSDPHADLPFDAYRVEMQDWQLDSHAPTGSHLHPPSLLSRSLSAERQVCVAPGTCPEFLCAADPELFSSLVLFSEKIEQMGLGMKCSPSLHEALGFDPYHVKQGT